MQTEKSSTVSILTSSNSSLNSQIEWYTVFNSIEKAGKLWLKAFANKPKDETKYQKACAEYQKCFQELAKIEFESEQAIKNSDTIKSFQTAYNNSFKKTLNEVISLAFLFHYFREVGDAYYDQALNHKDDARGKKTETKQKTVRYQLFNAAGRLYNNAVLIVNLLQTKPYKHQFEVEEVYINNLNYNLAVIQKELCLRYDETHNLQKIIAIFQQRIIAVRAQLAMNQAAAEIKLALCEIARNLFDTYIYNIDPELFQAYKKADKELDKNYIVWLIAYILTAEQLKKLFASSKAITSYEEFKSIIAPVLSNEQLIEIRELIPVSRDLTEQRLRFATNLAAAKIPGLRPYQRQAIDAIKVNWEKGHNHGFISMATGTGKTKIISAVVALSSAKRILILASSLSILTQLKEGVEAAAKEANVTLSVKIFDGLQKYISDKDDVIITTYQSFLVEMNKPLSDQHLKITSFELLIGDEAHCALGNQTSFRYKALFDKMLTLSVTATPTYNTLRKDGFYSALKELHGADKKIFSYSIKKAIADGYLVPCKNVIVTVDTELKIKKRSVKKDFKTDISDKEAEELANNEEINTLALDLYLNRLDLETGQPLYGKSTIIFCASIEHAEAVAKKFNSKGIAAESISGQENRHKQEEKLTAFRRGKIKVLCNANLISTGVDLPIAELIINLRPTRSKVMAKQRAGRVTRLANGKDYAIIIDINYKGAVTDQYFFYKALGNKRSLGNIPKDDLIEVSAQNVEALPGLPKYIIEWSEQDCFEISNNGLTQQPVVKPVLLAQQNSKTAVTFAAVCSPFSHSATINPNEFQGNSDNIYSLNNSVNDSDQFLSHEDLIELELENILAQETPSAVELMEVQRSLSVPHSLAASKKGNAAFDDAFFSQQDLIDLDLGDILTKDSDFNSPLVQNSETIYSSNINTSNKDISINPLLPQNSVLSPNVAFMPQAFPPMALINHYQIPVINPFAPIVHILPTAPVSVNLGKRPHQEVAKAQPLPKRQRLANPYLHQPQVSCASMFNVAHGKRPAAPQMDNRQSSSALKKDLSYNPAFFNRASIRQQNVMRSTTSLPSVSRSGLASSSNSAAGSNLSTMGNDNLQGSSENKQETNAAFFPAWR